ncbi:glyoxal reductase-like [Octopus vulgaris]|uniref:Glyoxal reductase-like n=1 Tax=Octopus vulgaris TaxID=6645 RepID=A0AA36B4X2_OCTVU|nr:glyoxal reductase-like [Octopus vulgaris]
MSARLKDGKMKHSIHTAKVKLNSGLLMPIVGLGTHKIQGKELIYSVLDAALAAGYRSIDTASVYKNESDIGSSLLELLAKYNLKREDIFITSKLGPRDQGSGKCREACLQSLSRLKTDYLDLYLIHWPGVQGFKPADSKQKILRQESWKDMEMLYKEGKLKSIGISNYQKHHLEELLQDSSVKPAVLQTEHHPHLVQHEVWKFCQENNIQYQAYSSLGASKDNMLLNDAVIKEISKKHQRPVAQILLRWAIQQGIGVLPKSTNMQHISENADIFSFELDDEEMKMISQIDSQHHYCWDSSTIV